MPEPTTFSQLHLSAESLDDDPIRVLEEREGRMAADLAFQALYFTSATEGRRRLLERVTDLEARVERLESGLASRTREEPGHEQ